MNVIDNPEQELGPIVTLTPEDRDSFAQLRAALELKTIPNAK
jgi:hypothetical protein